MNIWNMPNSTALAALLYLPLSGCVVFEDPIPTHCADRGGNDACADGSYCSTCRIAGGGCVPELPSLSCRVPDDYGSSSGSGTASGTTGGAASSSEGSGEGSTTGDSTDATTTTGSDPCVTDEDCTIENPFCDENGECVRCDEAGEGACARLNPDTTVCTPAGWCAECSPAEPDACSGATPICEHYQCRPCTNHSQCGEGACNQQTGECVPPDDGR